MSEERIGLVLSGGGAKGAYQIGVWKALKEFNMDSQIVGVSAASIGSLNAALFVGSSYEKGEEAWGEVDLLSVFDTDWALLDGTEGAFSREAMLELLRKYVNFEKIKTSDIPVYCSVSEVKPEYTFEGHYIPLQGKTQYAIERIIMASSALPIIHEEVEYEGTNYRDGGLTDNLPIKPLYDIGFRKMITVGLRDDLKDTEKLYPNVEFISIYPSHNMGGLFDGMLNFRQRYIEFGKRLGYKDACRILKAYKDSTLASMSDVQMQQLANLDFQEIMVDMKQSELQSSVDEHMDTLNRILGKYGI